MCDDMIGGNAVLRGQAFGVEPHGFDSRIDSALDIGCQAVTNDECLGFIEVHNLCECTLEKHRGRLIVADLLRDEHSLKVGGDARACDSAVLHLGGAIGGEEEAIASRAQSVEQTLRAVDKVVTYG